MSFSQEVKSELAGVECKTISEMKAQAYGMTIFSKLQRSDKVLFATESPMIARTYSLLMTLITGSIFDVNIPLNRKSLRDKQITVTSPDFPSRNILLKFFGHSSDELSLHINRANFDSEESFPSFLRGAFYHTEMLPTHKRIIIWNLFHLFRILQRIYLILSRR